MRNGKYELVVAPGNYPGKKYRDRYCYEHHLVWWQETGSLPGCGVVIHHKNGNKRDNRFSNLETMLVPRHIRLHGNEAKVTELLCAFCGVIFVRLSRNVEFKRRAGQKDFYCNRSCMGHSFGRGRAKIQWVDITKP